MSAYLLLAALLMPDVFGLAGVYGYPGDRFDKPGTACEATLTASVGKSAYRKMLALGVAHRSLECGTRLTLANGKRTTLAYVVDRGPFGITTAKGGWRAGRTLRNGEKWRGVLDLRPEVARRMGMSDGLFFVGGWIISQK